MPRQNVKFGLRQVKSSADAEREVSFSNSKNTCEANFTAKLLHAQRALHCADMAHFLPLVDCPVDSRATVTTESVTMPEQFDRQSCDGTVPVLPVCRDSFTPLELSNPTLLPLSSVKKHFAIFTHKNTRFHHLTEPGFHIHILTDHPTRQLFYRMIFNQIGNDFHQRTVAGVMQSLVNPGIWDF